MRREIVCYLYVVCRCVVHARAPRRCLEMSPGHAAATVLQPTQTLYQMASSWRLTCCTQLLLAQGAQFLLLTVSVSSRAHHSFSAT